tara:strand:- start:132 stop:404 length:273 start_codon:yes stop_codon:yes gene_type:complete
LTPKYLSIASFNTTANHCCDDLTIAAPHPTVFATIQNPRDCSAAINPLIALLGVDASGSTRLEDEDEEELLLLLLLLLLLPIPPGLPIIA